jgi:P-type conjugative transfer protein TrbG
MCSFPGTSALLEWVVFLKRARFWCLPVLLGMNACAAKLPPPRYYVRAEPLPEPPSTPAVVRIPEAVPLPGQLRPLPPAHGAERALREPCLTELGDGESKKKLTAAERKRLKKLEENCDQTVALIADANKRASQSPTKAGFYDAVQKYTFMAGAIYHVYCAPLRTTMIVLQPGEKVIGRPVFGDSDRFKASKINALAGKVEQQQIFLKATQPGMDTSIAIITNRRTYLLEAHALERDYMASVSWSYPDDEADDIEQFAEQVEMQEKEVTDKVDRSALYFKYEIEVLQGKPQWKPEQVFDDGKKTFIKFPRSMLVREAPAVFVGSGDELQMPNFRVSNEYYIIDRLFEVGELRLGQEKQDIVRLVRK